MDEQLHVLLYQNVPREIANWLKELRQHWTVIHACEVRLSRSSDQDIFEWAQQHQAIIVTFDEDFADRRSFPVGSHRGVVRLHVWPTTIEETERALGRLLEAVSDDELRGRL